jgi:hypothetical protein
MQLDALGARFANLSTDLTMIPFDMQQMQWFLVNAT